MKTDLSTFPKQPFYVKEIKEWKEAFTKELQQMQKNFIELQSECAFLIKEILGK